jgi:hypothetical protein
MTVVLPPSLPPCLPTGLPPCLPTGEAPATPTAVGGRAHSDPQRVTPLGRVAHGGDALRKRHGAESGQDEDADDHG